MGITPDLAYEQMMGAKRAFHQEKGKQYQHLVVSCDRELQNATVMTQIGYEMAEFFSDYQVLIATHTDTANLHCHLVINTVNMLTGKKLSIRRKDFWSFIKFANNIFTAHGLPEIGAKQVYELIFNDPDEVLQDDWEEFDDELYAELETLQSGLGVCRAIYFTDEEAERKDVLQTILRLRKIEDN
ncbi:MAG: relaxase/mobilization nuclease domain-containing protein [Oscillospiraceae bacterium]|nr:relaxase/mobilization nuclease domain-containing protein [Clostridiales bacterium]MCD8144037.1 relaxase/mobilization nuclease domain-containing protein [Oscillospiraceae bacterium]